MSQQEVEAALGQPNRTGGRGDVWLYYAADGTKLTVRFSRDDVLMDANHSNIGQKERRVASITNELGGRDIFKIMSERASQRTREQLAQKMEEQSRDWQASKSASHMPGRAQPNVVTLSLAPLAPADPVPPKRIIPAESYAAITVGVTREEVLTRLGEPNSRYAIAGNDGTHESLTYDLDSGETVVIRFLGGKVKAVR